MKEVVGIAFFKDGKLLISQSVKSAKNNKYTLVGGSIEEGETILQAAVRECKEEIRNGFEISENDFEPLLDFCEHAASDYNLMIHMHILLAKKEVNVELKPNEEILRYHWFEEGEDETILSTSISEHLLPEARKLKLFYKK
ncbi:MAG: NUDIX domain-containing protein [Clostridia bacterium]|nr:NUDIX domain-containing protein [Clostridia bacterium]